MKNIRNKLGVFALSVAFVGLPAMSAFASGGGSMGHSFETGRQFGQHVSNHAQAGHLGQNMNPGMHQGFSPWAPGN